MAFETSFAQDINGAADIVFKNAKIYALPESQPKSVLAMRDGKITYVGDLAGLNKFVASKTVVRDLGGQVVIPGLIDSHIHPLDIVDLDVCDLKSEPMSIEAIVSYIKKCIDHYKPLPGHLFKVYQWNVANGNQPSAGYTNFREALDKIGHGIPIELLGNDGHRGAFNSLGLAMAKNKAGKVIGFSKKTLNFDFKSLSKFIGVDGKGDLNGAVNEDARYAIDPNAMNNKSIPEVLKVAEKVTQRLNSQGITAILDASAITESQQVYDKLISNHKLTLRATLAQFYNLNQWQTPDGKLDIKNMLKRANEFRAKYSKSSLIRADTIKLFADGVLEGVPFSTPPSLPNAARMNEILQPIFGKNPNGSLDVVGYVDTSSKVCLDVRAKPGEYKADKTLAKFVKVNGFHPVQCEISNGTLQYERDNILEFVKLFHSAGFNLHIHAIGDRAASTAIDAIELARKADGVETTRDTIAHLQLVRPEDVLRIGRNHLFVAFTFAWAYTDIEYDLSVIPFIQKVKGGDYAALHVPGSYYEQNAYPVKAVLDAGGIVTAGSDAPTDDRSPRPFYNISMAVLRAMTGAPALNPKQSITVRKALAAYTLNGAKMLGRENEIGSIEVGKSADFVVIDQDIVTLGETGQAEKIKKTQVLETWFKGKRVYLNEKR